MSCYHSETSVDCIGNITIVEIKPSLIIINNKTFNIMHTFDRKEYIHVFCHIKTSWLALPILEFTKNRKKNIYHNIVMRRGKKSNQNVY